MRAAIASVTASRRAWMRGPSRLPLLWRHAAKRLQQPGHRALLAERRDPLRLERRQVRRRLDAGEQFVADRVQGLRCRLPCGAP